MVFIVTQDRVDAMRDAYLRPRIALNMEVGERLYNLYRSLGIMYHKTRMAARAIPGSADADEELARIVYSSGDDELLLHGLNMCYRDIDQAIQLADLGRFQDGRALCEQTSQVLDVLTDEVAKVQKGVKTIIKRDAAMLAGPMFDNPKERLTTATSWVGHLPEVIEAVKNGVITKEDATRMLLTPQ